MDYVAPGSLVAETRSLKNGLLGVVASPGGLCIVLNLCASCDVPRLQSASWWSNPTFITSAGASRPQAAGVVRRFSAS